ncbi:MAG TPA: L,D-transpeptidase family protein [Gaiellaceae bacterium]
MGRSLRTVFWHKWLLVAALVVVVACGGVVAAAYGYDRAQSDMIAKGVHVRGINIGGLSASAARDKLRRAYKVLERPLVLRYHRGHLVLSGREAQVEVNIDQLVDQALARSRHGFFISRAWRDLTGGHVDTTLRPRVHYSPVVVQSTVEKLRGRIDIEPVDAVLEPSYDRVVIKSGHRGSEVKASLLRWRMRHALVSRHAARRIKVPVRRVPPKVTVDTLRKQNPSYITIDRGAFTLRVYKNLKFVKSYGIAVGQAGLETPEGVYHVQDKQVDPWWHVPNSAWAGSLAGQVIPPGPSDPLKARWMGIFNGAGIHGTEETWSIGHAVSHGCVRMLIPDVIDLYDRVSVGTPVYIGN